MCDLAPEELAGMGTMKPTHALKLSVASSAANSLDIFNFGSGYALTRCASVPPFWQPIGTLTLRQPR
jgi:hypothetical protein